MYENRNWRQLQQDFTACSQVLAAIGDETRQLILLELMAAGCDGMRVGEITVRTHLSRPAVSHHLKVMKEAGIVAMYKLATRNYYYVDPTSKLMDLKKLIADLEAMLA